MQETRYTTSKRVTLVSIYFNIFLSVIKIVFGYLGHSEAVIADGVHSISDIATDVLIIVAAKFGSKLPDEEHPYGHGRIETIISIIVALLVAAVGALIMYNAIHSLIAGEPSVHPGWIAAAVAFIAVLSKEWLYHYTLAAGKRVNSNLLRANAWHNRSDAFVSLIVLVGVLGAMLGYPYMDPIAALIVGVFILKTTAEMIWQSISELIDSAVDEKTLQKIKHCILSIEGVNSIHQLRTRSLGGSIFVDVHVLVNAFISVSEGHFIGEKVRSALLKNLTHVADVTVHIDPENDEIDAPSLGLPSRETVQQTLTQRWKDLPHYSDIRKTNLHYLSGKIYVEVLLSQSVLQTQVKLSQLAAQYQATCEDIDYIEIVDIHLIL